MNKTTRWAMAAVVAAVVGGGSFLQANSVSAHPCPGDEEGIRHECPESARSEAPVLRHECPESNMGTRHECPED